MTKNISFNRPNLRNKAELIVGISNWCNYDCSYCMPHSKSRTSRHEESDEIIKLVNASYSHFKANSPDVDYYGVLFVGGEPSIHPGFEKIIDSIQCIRKVEPDYKIIIVTNLSRTTRWWGNMSKKVTGIVASYHDEFTNPITFAEKVVHCMQANPELYVTIGIQPLPGKLDYLNIHTEQIREAITNIIGESHASSKLDFIIQHLYKGEDELYPYSAAEFDKFNTMINEFSNPNIKEVERLSSQEEFLTHSFAKDDEYLGSLCYAGVESLTLGFNGDVMRTARCGLSHKKKVLGNIYTGYELPTSPVVCDAINGCGNCWFDYAVMKRSRDDG